MGEGTKIGGTAGLRSLALMLVIMTVGGGLAAWKVGAAQEAEAAAAAQPEPVEVVGGAAATSREYQDATTSIGTVVATRSVTLRNEVPGTVRRVELTPGRVVEAGTVLVAMDVSVEEAELRALQARAELARTTLQRYERMAERQAASAIEVDNARAERDIAQAEMARLEAVIERKTIRAPFRARVGIADVHPGQFLETGTLLTTLQGVDDAVYVDFTVSQAVASGLGAGTSVEVVPGQNDRQPVAARVMAVDARVDPSTRNAMVRARIDGVGADLTPGASVQVRVPVAAARTVVMVPVVGLRRGPAGDHVFVLVEDEAGQMRAHVRQVRTGPVVGDQVVVLSGVEAGERVATSGSFKLREAVRVQVADEAAVAVGGEG